MARATSRLAALTLVVLAPGRAEGASACKDLNDYCADWAARGECEANPGYMLVMCPAACGACGAEPTTQPPPASSCSSFDGMRADADLAGDLVAKVKGQSVASCCGACDATASCEGFSYLPPYCYLKANLTGTFAHEGCSTRLRATPTDCSGFGALREGVDLAANCDFRRLHEMLSPMQQSVLLRIDSLAPRIGPKIEQVKVQLRDKWEQGLWNVQDVEAALNNFERLLREAGEIPEADMSPVVLDAASNAGGSYRDFWEVLVRGLIDARIDFLDVQFTAVQNHLRQKLSDGQWSHAQCNRYIKELLEYVTVLKGDCRGEESAEDLDSDLAEFAEEVLHTLEDGDTFDDALAKLVSLKFAS